VDHVLLITNAGAGSNDERAVETAAKVLREQARVDVAATCDKAELEAALSGRGDRDVVVAGGDGSLHAVVAVLRRLDDLAGPTIGLIPLGTGNDFARGVEIPLTPEAAARVILSGEPRKVDILVDDDDHVVVNAVHMGVGAEAAIEARPWKSAFGKLKLGKVGYAIGAVVASSKTQGLRLRVVADGSVLADGRHRVLQVGVLNGSKIGGGTEMAPDAVTTDGLADVLVSFSVSPLGRFLYGVHLKRGTHDERHDVKVAQATSVSVTGEEFWCNADGELAGPMTSRSWSVHPKAFTMVLPSRSAG